jgi:hypothetical protein
MVIQRLTVSCGTCKTNHTLRISLGTDRYQEHTFPCVNCGEDMSVRLDIDFDDWRRFDNLPAFKAPKTKFSTVSNCEVCQTEGTVINLDPNFLVAENSLHKKYYFSSIHQAERLGAFERIEKTKDYFSEKQIVDIFSLVGGFRNLREKLDFLIKAWSLHNRGKENLALKYLDKLAEDLFDKSYPLHESIIMFSALFIGEERSEEMKTILNEIKEAKSKNSLQYYNFRSYYLKEHVEDCLERHLESFNDYLKNYDDLLQLYLYAKQKQKITEDISLSSKKFRNLKMFYGNIYEHITSSLFILAAINNILSGRNFDIFEEMDLKKYMTINKANRANPFKDRHSFDPVVQCLDSTLRNASHHGAMKLQINSNIIQYRSGGTGALNTISYTEYLQKCNEMMFSSCMLLIVELMILKNLI